MCYEVTEEPIVFVKLDRYAGALLSTDLDKHNIVPFTEWVNEIRLTVNGTHYMHWQLPLILAYSIITHKLQSMTAHNGIVYKLSKATDLEKVALLMQIRQDQFINKNFTAKNIKINEFFNNLNKKIKKYRLHTL
jgi:hypothetical protein